MSLDGKIRFYTCFLCMFLKGSLVQKEKNDNGEVLDKVTLMNMLRAMKDKLI